MGFMQNYLYKKRIKNLEIRLEVFKSEPNEYYRTEKLVETKRGVPVYLIHCTYSEDEQTYSGNIHVLTSKGFDGTLSYDIEPTGQSIKICDIKHTLKNQGIGAQLLIYLDEIARESGINKVTGWLSPIDLDTHRERLIHFYEKNGYQIAEGRVPNLNIDGLIATKYLYKER
ncbi:MAG: GNAT family N-acetyltransferase [Syntrophomonas sp.]